MQSEIFGVYYDLRYKGDELSKCVAAKIADLTEKAIHEEIVREARAAGVTDLYLMDRDFVLSALREKQERMNPQPLTLEELLSMIGEPVWVVSNFETARDGCWELMGESLLILYEDYTFYRHKPQEVTQ